jgi:hypothetical protein
MSAMSQRDERKERNERNGYAVDDLDMCLGGGFNPTNGLSQR